MIIELAVALAIQQPEAAFADLPQVTVRTYLVEGRKAAEVRESINAARPSGSDGQGRDAATSWTYAVRWANSADGACLPETAEVAYQIVVTLPALGEEARLNANLRERWDDWVAYLTSHERRRIDGLVSGFGAMQASLRAAPDCAAMNARQTEAALAIAEQNRALDQALADQYRRNPRRLPTFP